MAVFDCTTGKEREATAEEIAELEAERAAIALIVQPIVSARQIKLALLQAGLLDQIEAFVATQDRAVRIGWEYAVEYLRDDPTLLAMAAAFGMSDEQIDDLFRLAATL